MKQKYRKWDFYINSEFAIWLIDSMNHQGIRTASRREFLNRSLSKYYRDKNHILRHHLSKGKIDKSYIVADGRQLTEKDYPELFKFLKGIKFVEVEE